MRKVLFAAMALAMLAGCKENKQAETANGEEAQEQTSVMTASDMAYVQVDVVMTQCDMFQGEGVALRDKTEKAQNSWAQKEQKLQSELAQLQEKYQKGLITTRDAQQKEQDLQKRAADYQTSAQKEAKTLEEENMVFSNRMNDLLARAIREINSDNRYKLVINASALLDGEESLDITQQVLDKMNELYKEEKSKK